MPGHTSKEVDNEKQKYHTVGTAPKLNRKNVERDKIDIPSTQIYDRSLANSFNQIALHLNKYR
jgi:hypothetical protein